MLKRIAVVLVALLMASAVFAQKKEKAPAEKSVSGIVTDAGGNAVPGAVVQLKNMKTLQVRSFIAKEKGDYYFHGLSTDVDYQLLAQANGKESAPRTVSTFDSHTQVIINFQVK
ncbi:MAG: carboxypeptidase-like regulatory domain-containing protein [Acidobacteriota bacterium]